MPIKPTRPMMGGMLVLSLLLASFSFADNDDSSSLPGRLLFPGVFHGEEVSARTGESWLGLFPDREWSESEAPETLPAFQLRKAVLQINTVPDPIVDPDDRHWTGKEVAVQAKPAPMMLFKSLPMLSEGPVETVFYEPYAITDAEAVQDFVSHTLAFHGRTYRVEFTHEGEGAGGLLRNLKVTFVREADGERQAQVLETYEDAAPYSEGGTPALIWAGDLDRDGELDLLLDLANHYNLGLMTLFLSSPAGEGRLLRKMAELSTYGC